MGGAGRVTGAFTGLFAVGCIGFLGGSLVVVAEGLTTVVGRSVDSAGGLGLAGFVGDIGLLGRF